jgi:hypothetical protein
MKFKMKIMESYYKCEVGQYFVYRDDPYVYKIVGTNSTGIYYAWSDKSGCEILTSNGYIITHASFKKALTDQDYKYVSEEQASESLREFKI